MAIDAKAKVFAVIGDPVEHSLSPAMHNAAFSNIGINAVYVALHVLPANLSAAIAGFKATEIAGLNVTIPHKLSVIPLVDGLDESARSVGAVNTIINKDGKLVGYNTDVYGFRLAVQNLVGSTKGMKVVLLGAGGGSRAVVQAFDGSNELVVLNRSVANAQKIAGLARTSKATALALNDQNIRESLKGADLVVNATPLGLHGENPVPEGLLRKDLTVFDLTYERKKPTALVEAARKVGAKAADGKELLLYQGVKAFELFTGRPAPIEVMRRAIEE